MNKIFLGTMKEDNKRVYLTKHSWDCGWYWGFGYIGNNNLHTHFDSVFLKEGLTASELFVNPKFTDSQWWVIRDLFVQAYALKKVAEVYRHGGHQTTLPGVTDVITNKEKADLANADLKLVLETLWNYMTENKNG